MRAHAVQEEADLYALSVHCRILRDVRGMKRSVEAKSGAAGETERKRSEPLLQQRAPSAKRP